MLCMAVVLCGSPYVKGHYLTVVYSRRFSGQSCVVVKPCWQLHWDLKEPERVGREVCYMQEFCGCFESDLATVGKAKTFLRLVLWINGCWSIVLPRGSWFGLHSISTFRALRDKVNLLIIHFPLPSSHCPPGWGSQMIPSTPEQNVTEKLRSPAVRMFSVAVSTQIWLWTRVSCMMKLCKLQMRVLYNHADWDFCVLYWLVTIKFVKIVCWLLLRGTGGQGSLIGYAFFDVLKYILETALWRLRKWPISLLMSACNSYTEW